MPFSPDSLPLAVLPEWWTKQLPGKVVASTHFAVVEHAQARFINKVVAAEQRDPIALAPRPGAGASQQPETDPAPGGFGGGPLQEMDRTARKILAGLGERMGPELTSEAPATMTPQGEDQQQCPHRSAPPPTRLSCSRH